MARTTDRRDMARARTGLLLIAAVTLIALAGFFADVVVRATTEGPRITVTTDAAPGIEPGTPVWVAGREVGRVLSVRFGDPIEGEDRIAVEAVLERGVEVYIRGDATAKIQPGALLEPEIVIIDPGSPGRPAWDLDEPLRTRTESLDPEALLELGEGLMAKADTLRLQATRVEAELARRRGTLGRLLEDPEVLLASGDRLAELGRLLEREYPEGTLGRMAADTSIAPRLRRIRGRLAALDTLGARDRARRSYAQTRAALTNFQDRLDAMSTRLDAGEGTVGRALVDGELSRQLALLRARIDSATVELTRRPDRWLRVKVFE